MSRENCENSVDSTNVKGNTARDTDAYAYHWQRWPKWIRAGCEGCEDSVSHTSQCINPKDPVLFDPRHSAFYPRAIQQSQRKHCISRRLFDPLVKFTLNISVGCTLRSRCICFDEHAAPFPVHQAGFHGLEGMRWQTDGGIWKWKRTRRVRHPPGRNEAGMRRLVNGRPCFQE